MWEFFELNMDMFVAMILTAGEPTAMFFTQISCICQ